LGNECFLILWTQGSLVTGYKSLATLPRHRRENTYCSFSEAYNREKATWLVFCWATFAFQSLVERQHCKVLRNSDKKVTHCGFKSQSITY
jgi:hypothetical protein